MKSRSTAYTASSTPTTKYVMPRIGQRSRCRGRLVFVCGTIVYSTSSSSAPPHARQRKTMIFQSVIGHRLATSRNCARRLIAALSSSKLSAPSTSTSRLEKSARGEVSSACPLGKVRFHALCHSS